MQLVSVAAWSMQGLPLHLRGCGRPGERVSPLHGSACVKSAAFAVDGECDMVACRSVSGGTYCFGSGAQRCFTVLLNVDSRVSG